MPPNSTVTQGRVDDFWRITLPRQDRQLVLEKRSAVAWSGLALFWFLVFVMVLDMGMLTLGNAPPTGLALTVAGLASVGVGYLAIRAGTSRRYFALALASGAVFALPFLRGILSGQVGSLIPVAIALGSVALCLAADHVPPEWFRMSVLVMVTALMVVNLVVGLSALLGAEVASLYTRGFRELFGLDQLRGISGHPNLLAIIAAVALVVQVGTLIVKWRSMRPWLVIGLLAVGPVLTVLVLVWSQSRVGIAAAVAGVLALALTLPGWLERTRAWTVMAIMLLLSFVPYLVWGQTGLSFHGREVAWELAWTKLAANIPWGYGPELFTPDYWAAFPNVLWEPAHAHNQFLQIGGTAGVIGLLILGYFVALAIAIGVQTRRVDAGWAIGVIAVVLIAASLEVALGVENVLSTYLPALLLVVVLASSLALLSARSSGIVRSSSASADKGMFEVST